MLFAVMGMGSSLSDGFFERSRSCSPSDSGETASVATLVGTRRKLSGGLGN